MGTAVVLVFCRWMIGLAFAVSASGKARKPGPFRSTIIEIGIIPARLATTAVIAAVTAEALAAILMLTWRVGALAGFVLAAALLAIFSVVVSLALHQRADVSCNCFGPGERRISWYDLARNVILLLCCTGGLSFGLRSGSEHFTAEVIVALGLTAAGFLIITANLEDFIEILRRPHLFG